MSGWTLEDKMYGLLSAAAPLVAFACAASFYGNLKAVSGNSADLASPNIIISVIGVLYFAAMVIAGVINLSGLVGKFETGEPISRSHYHLFWALSAFGAANILIALIGL